MFGAQHHYQWPQMYHNFKKTSLLFQRLFFCLFSSLGTPTLWKFWNWYLLWETKQWNILWYIGISFLNFWPQANSKQEEGRWPTGRILLYTRPLPFLNIGAITPLGAAPAGFAQQCPRCDNSSSEVGLHKIPCTWGQLSTAWANCGDPIPSHISGQSRRK